jgi:hypothetical protein
LSIPPRPIRAFGRLGIPTIGHSKQIASEWIGVIGFGALINAVGYILSNINDVWDSFSLFIINSFSSLSKLSLSFSLFYSFLLILIYSFFYSYSEQSKN